MGLPRVITACLLMWILTSHKVESSQVDMRGFFQNVGNEKNIRFPVYKEVKGYDIFLRFTTSQCTGQLLDITSRNNKQYLRITLLGVGPIRVAFNTRRGKGQLDIAMRSKGSFCDGKRHTFSLSLFRGAVYYNVDGSSYIRYYVSRLGVPFSSPDKIVLGKGVQGCITDSTVTVRASKTQEYVLQMSDECSVKKTTLRPSKPPVITYSARKIARSTVSVTPKCEPLTLTACKELGYNLTQVPNALQQKTSSDASMKLLVLLSNLRPNCSPHLIPFLCQLYLPPCALPQQAAPPCQSLCQSVQEDCASGVNRWPAHLSCKRFPRANNETKCFLGSTKVTSRRTTLLRGENLSEEDLTETNTMKKTDNKSRKYSPRKDVKTTEIVFKPTTANPKSSRLKTNDRESKFTTKMNLITSGEVKASMKPLTTKPITRLITETITAGKYTKISKEKSVTARNKRESSTTKPTTTKTTGKLTTIIKNVTVTQNYTKIRLRNPTRIFNRTRPTRPSVNTNASQSQFNSSVSPLLTVTPTTNNVEGGCGGVLATAKGKLMSPGYPVGYPSNTTCRWTIALPNNYHVIRFTIHRVYLEEDRNCVYDYIAVYDLLDNQVGQRYCGSIMSPVYKEVKGNVAVVVFHSDSTNSKKGFVLSYEAHTCLTSAKVEE
ncbi:unnamed protein product [Porites lobata]|uniref:Uncharacterized protein n=1 Tax=Porites lobata TaxID=104759 RepID=A0ABN8QIX3_9CNID|nr:unnamed protein product [Porites lobata]